ncbi:hypothetical protein L5515_006945 [Caenorhabditis briggsae]|uniref:L-Fucosyltransferase n=1 Tax=Caenorhabditis briggsae TaxID=6238 RepID=A0AAE9F3F4_CAEBR|nr:hypothetical protein L5515_006945 [Caenorhabditis briggsae]
MAIEIFPTLKTPSKPRAPKKYLSSNLAASSRLGNHLFELSALLSMSRKLNRVPTFFIQDEFHDQMIKDTDFLIPGLVDHFLIINQSLPISIIPTEFHMKCCIWDDPEKLMKIEDEYLHIQGTHFQSWKYFPRMRNELISYLKKPKNEFKDLPKSTGNHSITCIHIRRTDFVGSGFHSPDNNFILSAMKFVEETEKQRRNLDTTFVFFGDDLKFMEELLGEEYVLKDGTIRNLKNESYISKDDPQDTILYSSSNCDVVLFTAPHSTFGWWLGYLSKGNQVYYTDIRVVADVSVPSLTLYPDDYYPPHWTPIKSDKVDNTTIIETLK